MAENVAKRLEGLTPEQRAQLVEKLRLKAQATAQAVAQEQAIPRRPDLAAYPLSYAQQRMWILSQLEPDSPFYNIALALRLSGRVNIQALEDALNEIIRRHEVLRATFITERGNPIQVIAPELRLSMTPEDVAGPDAEAAALAIASAEAGKPFDLARGPLARARLLRLREDGATGDYLALLTFHHIVTDGWSTGVLVTELATLYDAYCRGIAGGETQGGGTKGGETPPLQPLPLQYADYAAWERERLQGERLEKELTYWKAALANIPLRLELPTDRPRPAVQTVNGAVQPFELPAELTAKLHRLARAEGATLYQVLLAAYQVLLHRYSNQDDICVGAPIANRQRQELEGLIGFFVNTVVMRSNFADNPSFRDLLRRLKESALAAQAHQDVPFELLVDALGVQRNMATTPVFQVMFTLEQRSPTGLKLRDTTITPVETHSGTAKFDVTLLMIEDTADGAPVLRGSFEYNTDLWYASTIAHMAAHYRRLLESIVAAPDERVGLLPILLPDEERQLLHEWNDTATDYPRDRCLSDLFEEQVRLRGDAAAVTYDGQSLSYAALNERANRLAHWLQELGVGPESLVGVYLERGHDMIVALLGIIKAGGAYLPLDMEYPAERLAFMMRDGAARALITHSALEEQTAAILAGNDGVRVIRMDADAAEMAQHNADDLSNDATPNNLAYVIYTSGSTGVPKGVSIPQCAIARLIFNTNYIDLHPSDKIGQASNASFDAATFEIWGALLRGAELVGVRKELALSPKDFARFLRDAGINTLFLTTALVNHIAAEEPTAFNTLDCVMFGGEAVDPRWVRRILEYGGPRRLLHVYGPTESTTFASWYPIHAVPSGAVTIPIGRPLSNTQMYVLDRHFRPTPIGVSGELCIGGDGLAVSYLHRPELTAEKFVPNPFNGHGNPRLYRTGDLVRYLPDGSIEFQGRIDHQVKVRGFRIELGEIEAVLGRNPQVRQAFVMVRQDATGEDKVSSSERKVVAYIVPAEGASPTASDLRADLKDRLPDYMIPAAFVFMASLPINPNGKVDRKALPPPDYAKIEAERPYVAPRSPVERFLTQKWQEVLGIERVSVTDNFFELGGNSLQAAVLTNRMQEELGASAHVRALFMAPTIADLATYLDEYYPDAVARITGISPIEKAESGSAAAGYTFTEKAKAGAQIDDAKVAQFRVIVPPLPDRIESVAETAQRNPPAVFVLSPPRSGSTLLRVMLGGNPRLFAPPELDLLSFNTLRERRAAFSGKYQFWLEGPIKAIMELRKCGADEAEQIMAGFEAEGWTTKRFYRQMQEWIVEDYRLKMEQSGQSSIFNRQSSATPPRLLVDKTPVYPMDSAILDRMEQDFANVKYIHLVRHPFATVYSFMEAKLEEVFFRWEHPWTMRELAELVYLVSHRNILAFLDRIPQERQHRVWFEEMVGDAPRVMQGVCDFLEIDFHPDMLEPYKGDKMTSGIRPGHQMVGDFKFYLRNKIDPKAADRWKRFKKGDALADMTWDVARRFNYEMPAEDEGANAGGAGNAAGNGSDGARSQPQLAIRPRQAGEPVALSFAQERLWFLDQFEPGSPFYNVPAAVRLTGNLDVAALHAALNAIVARHEVLHTTFRSVDGVATPDVAAQMVIPLPVVDLTALPAAERDAAATKLAAEEARKPFDLANGPLLRGQLLDLGEGPDGRETVALITMHHIVSDGWSVNVFIRELAALYAAYASGQSSPEGALAPLPIQYADFAAWQRKWFGAQDVAQVSNLRASPLQQQLAYWKEHLNGLPPMLELPTDRPRPAVQTLNGERHTFTLSGELTAKLRTLARGEGATMFMTLLAAFQTLLMRYTGQEDIAVGTPIAGRNRPEIANLIGFFVNTLVMRGDLAAHPGEGAPTFRQLLKRTQATAIKAYENQDAPFEMLVETLLRQGVEPQRDMSHTPLFQVMFALQDAPLQAMKAPGLTLSPMQPDTKTSKFDLMLNIVERTDVMRCALEYNTDLFDAGTIIRMAERIGVLLESIVAEPDRAITTLPMLSAAERQMLFSEWNDTAAEIDTDSTLPRRFEEQAARTPDALAVVAEVAGETQSLTYRELDARASEVARRLAWLCVGPESMVGLMADRSVDLLVGALGIWKAGAAYVPLDPSYPADRLAYMLSDSGARVVVTQERFATADVVDGLSVVLLDRPDLHAPTAEPQPAGPDHLAYIIYTSGSTGRPKGVAVPHRNALNLAGALKKIAYDRSDLGRPLRVSLNAPLAFDASVQQLVMLTQGHTVVIIPQEARTDAPALLQFIRRHRLDQLDCVPSQLKLLLAEGLLAGDAWTPSIVFPGGEAIDEPTWAALAAAPATHFYNMYGPTECAVDSTTISARLAPRRPTIGRPMANARVYVLDRNLEPAGIGIPGELYIAGAGVTRGYLGRPDLTAERFLPDPFAKDLTGFGNLSGLRMYRTGDRVRWLPDGTLEFLGRVDFQVKVRGFRIELGEIEETLRKHESIKEAVVLAPEGEDGARRLLAYVAPHDPVQPPTAASLRGHLLATLPEYMVPAAFLVLDAMPLTPNGKIDRNALRRIKPEEAVRAESGGAYVAPSGPVETALAEIYAKVLGLPQVGANDNFFELGGDSILTIQVVARAGQAGIRLTPKQLFQAPTPAGLALLAEVAPAAALDAEQGTVEGELPLTPIERVFFDSGFVQPDHWNQSLLLSVRGRLNPAALEAATAAVARHHDALRLRFTETATGWRQTNAGVDGPTPFEFVDLSALSPSARSEALREQTLVAQQSLDIRRGPLARVVYFDYGPDEPGRLLTVVHHLAIDRVSWRVLLEDLGGGYEQAAAGQPIRLSPKTTSFRAWAHRLAEFAQSPALREEAAHWLRLERSRPAPLTLDCANGGNTEADARTAAVFLEEAETEALLREAGQAYGTDAKELLLAGLAQAFEKWAGAPQLFVQVEGHGRQPELLGRDASAVDLSRTVGWFTTLYPALFELKPGWGPRETLLAVKEQARSAPNGGIGFGLLRYLSADEALAERIARLPEPQISFNYLGQFVQDAAEIGVFGPAPENSGPDHASANRRQCLLDVTASVFAGRLRAEFTYSDAQFAAETIETLAELFIEATRVLIQHCLSPEAGGYSASDFADAGLDDEGVQDLLLELGEIDD